MKSFLLIVSVLFVVNNLSAQVLLFEEDFDSYQVGDYAGAVAPFIGTWSGNTGFGTDDCQVTDDEAFSPSKSIGIFGPAGGGNMDVMINFPSDYTSGRFEFSMKLKVPAGKGAYFNVQSSSAQLGTAWMVQAFFAANSTGKVYGGGQNMPFSYFNGEWVDILLDCDIDKDTAYMWIDGNLVGTGFNWSSESTGAGNGSNYSLGGINLYSASGDPTADCEYYIDDIRLEENVGLGLNTIYKPDLIQVTPNPAKDHMKIKLLDATEPDSRLSIRDAFGRIIYEGILSKNELVVPLTSNGIYFVQYRNEVHRIVKL